VIIKLATAWRGLINAAYLSAAGNSTTIPENCGFVQEW